MASLIEDFIDTLTKENEEYQTLLEISGRKTPIIVKGDVESLAKITDEEQMVVDRITVLDKHREEVLTGIACVLNKDVQTLKVPELIKLLDRQEKEKQALSQIYEKLKVTVEEMKTINERNKGLIQLSLEMIQFDMNLMQAASSGPETGDYNRNGAYSQGSFPAGASRFDSKS